MKKLLFLFPLLLVLSLARAQTITNTSAVPHTTGTPSGAPSTYGSWLRYDKTNKILYQWTGAAWTRVVGTVADGDKGSITVSGSGGTWSVDVGEGGIYEGSGTVPASTVATATNGFSLNSGASGQLLFGDYGGAGLGTNLNLQGSGAILGSPSYQFRTQVDDQYTQMVSPGYTVRLEPTTAYTLIQSTATNGYKFWDTRATPRGVEYTADYSATYNPRSLVDKAYVDGSDSNGIYSGSGTIPSGTAATVTDEFTIDRSGGGQLRVNDTGTFLYGTNAGETAEVSAGDDGVNLARETTASFSITSTGVGLDDKRATPRGIEYLADYSATYTNRSLVDKAYVATINATNANLTGPVTSVGNATTITADAVGASQIATDAVGSSEIAASAVGASEIASNAVDSTKVAASGLSPSDIGPSGASIGQVLMYTANGWRPATISSYSSLDLTGTAISNSAAETTVLTHSVGANEIAAGQSLRFHALADFVNNTGANTNFTLRLKVGGTTFFSDGTGNIGTGGTRAVTYSGVIVRTGATTAQVFVVANISGLLAPTTGVGDLGQTDLRGCALASSGNVTWDWSTAVSFTATVQLSTANVAHTYTQRFSSLAK